MFGLAVPMEVVIIQLYYHMFSLHLLNTRTGLILAQIALSLPFGVFFMSANLNALPHAILESAEIEGADTWGIRFGKMMSGIYWIKTAGISQMESAFSESKG